MKGEIYQNPDRELYIFSKHGSIRSGAEPFAAVREDGQLVDFVRTDDFNGFDPSAVYLAKVIKINPESGHEILKLFDGKKGSVFGYYPAVEHAIGDHVICRMTKPATPKKNCSVSCKIQLASETSVLILNDPRPNVYVSSEINDADVRARLIIKGDRLLNKLDIDLPCSVIMRTSAAEADETLIDSDFDSLIVKCDKILKTTNEFKRNARCGVVFGQYPLSLIVGRYVSTGINKIYSDSAAEVERLKSEFPLLGSTGTVITTDQTVFDGVLTEFARVSGREVNLPSGGNIVIDRTEALTAIDVNSASGSAGLTRREIILRTNTEATREIMRQLRLRNTGGIIVCDFINMEYSEDRAVITKTAEALSQLDRATTDVFGFTGAGLFEIVRSYSCS